MKKKTFLGMNNKGQADIIGNLLDLIKTQPFILLLIFLAILYATTITISFMGVPLNLAQPLNLILGTVADVFGFGFDWRLFVIVCFLAVGVVFIFKYGHAK